MSARLLSLGLSLLSLTASAQRVGALEGKKIAVLEFAVAPGAKVQSPDLLSDDCRGAVAEVTRAEIEVFARERRIRYDADEDEHHDTISAFIKSCRGCDPDAAMYWLAKMLAGGEDPRFIARRLVILASEDVGLADPQALPLAVAAHHAVDFVGLPEAEYALAHATLYLATAPKSNSATLALGESKRVLRDEPVQAIPAALRSKGGQANKRHGHGADYDYSYDFPEGISGQDYLERPVSLYSPKTAGWEAKIADRLARWRQLKVAIQASRGEAAR